MTGRGGRPGGERSPDGVGSAAVGSPAASSPAVGSPAADSPPRDGVSRRGSRAVSAGPLYPRLLRLKHLKPSAWQRVVLFDGVITLSVIAVLADQASLWTIPLLPAVVAAAVKFNDVLAGLLRNDRADSNGAGPDRGRRRRGRRGVGRH